MQGNIIDLCPVGALTSKPYAFTARPWELRKTETIDVMDALGANIRVDSRGHDVMRILPRNHDGVNEEWISDKTRFVWDGLRSQRLDRPYVRIDGALKPATWAEALGAAANAIKGGKLASLAGDLVSVEAMFALKQLTIAHGGQVECRTDGACLPAGNRSAFVGTARIEDIDEAGSIILVGSDPRWESPVLNARIRKAWLDGATVSLVGAYRDLTYDVEHLGTGRAALAELAGRTGGSGVNRGGAIVIVGQGALQADDGHAVLGHAMRVADSLDAKFMVLHTAAARVGGMDLGFVTEGGLSAALDGADTIFNFGVDEIDLPEGAFVIYQGSHGDRGAHRADVILPGAAYTEEDGIFVNTEGRPQQAIRACFPPGEARENWAILRALSAELGTPLPFDTLAELRNVLFETCGHLQEIDQVPTNEWEPIGVSEMSDGDFRPAIDDFYLTNPIARASPVMAELSRNHWDRQSGHDEVKAA